MPPTYAAFSESEHRQRLERHVRSSAPVASPSASAWHRSISIISAAMILGQRQQSSGADLRRRRR